MAQIHNLENKSRYGIKYIAGFGLLVSALLLSGWFAFFTFLPIKSAMEVVTNLEEKFLPRAEGMVLDFVSLSEPSIIVTSDNQILDELHDGLNRDPIKLSDVPPFVINTLLAAEDSNYYQHEGVDFVAILSAVVDNLRGVTRGGSTITSQVAKQSFVGDEISIRRKVAEAVVAAELERRYSKDQILEYYINSIYWGSGAYGLQSASSEYFNKDVADIAKKVKYKIDEEDLVEDLKESFKKTVESTTEIFKTLINTLESTISDEEIKRDSKNVVENFSSELKQVINDTKSKFTGTTEVNTKFEEE